MTYMEHYSKLCLKADRATIALSLYLCEKYGDGVDFSFNILFNESFDEYIRSNNLQPYHKATISNSMKWLHDYGFVLRLHRGIYAVNPKFCYRGLPKLRDEAIQKLYARASKYESIEIKKHNEN